MPNDLFYRSPPWLGLRARFLRAHPACQQCGAPANTIDHLYPRRQFPALALTWANLQALCHSCHSTRTAVLQTPQNRRAAMTVCDEGGRPLHPEHPWNMRR